MSRDNDTTHSLMTRRAALVGGAQIGVAGLLGWRMYDLGVRDSAQYRLLAEENRVNIRLDPPARGLIYDRSGNALTLNKQVYTIEMVREQAGDAEAVLQRLSKIIPLSDRDIENALKEMNKRRAFVPVTVATGLEWEHIAAVSANAPALPGLTPKLALNRQYPNGADFAHIIGYVGPVSENDLSKLDKPDPLLLIPRFQIGKNGVEAKLENNLRGKAGVSQIEVNSVGRVMRELNRDPSQSGQNVQLTVDPDIQRYALQRMQGESAAVVVLDVTNGDVIALASAPSFDPNKFVNGISVPDWRALNENIYRPMANKTVQGTYPPGSTFKMVVGLAGLELGAITPSERIFCPGHMQISNRRFHCWRRGGHGRMNLIGALRESCDVYFYEVAIRIGIEKITEYANALGLGTAPDLPLPAVRNGLTPTKDWKRRVRKQEWFPGDTANSGIGQGFVLASPIQLAMMTARLASGTAVTPRLVNLAGGRITDAGRGKALPFNPENLDIIRRGMYEVVNSDRGTARGSALRGNIKMSGKTGTSQVRIITAQERAQGVTRNEDLPWERRDHALFVGYAPHDDPKYAVSVIVEHGGGGSRAAAPIARDVMEKVLAKEQGGYGTLPQGERSQT
ncbi:MAG: penicillin-binding protein 2 [Pseudomonadota bacterium]